MMQWIDKGGYAQRQVLVSEKGEILAEVTRDGSNYDWIYKLRKFIDMESAQRAAEREVKNDPH